MSFSAHIDQGDLHDLQEGLGRLIHHLPTHNVAALRRAGTFVESGMKRRAQVFQIEGHIVRSIGATPVKLSAATWRLEVGPGASGQPAPIYAPLQETGWKQGKFPPTLRIMNWAARRFGAISVRQAFFIARAIARRGALSPHNPRAHGEPGYYYIAETIKHEGEQAHQELLDAGFDFVAKAWSG